MVQASWRRVLVGVFGAVMLGMGGCASTHSSAKVNEEWLARVPESQLEGVRQAQLTQRKAADEVTRTGVALQDARQAQKVARNNEEAANSSRKASEAAVGAARARGQGAAISQAQEDLRRADMELSVAKAELDFRDRAVTTLESLERLRKRELDVAKAELAQQQYLALERSGDVRARELSGADFAKAVADARRKAEDTQREVESHLAQERQARAQWMQLRGQSQAYGGGGFQGSSTVPPTYVK